MDDFSALKEAVPIRTVLEYLGVDIPQWAGGNIWRMACPIHDGQNPTTFRVNEGANSWHCYKCDKGGSALDFIMALEGTDLFGAAEKLRSIAGGDVKVSPVGFGRTTVNKVRNWQSLREFPPALGSDEMPDTVPLEVGYRNLGSECIQRFGLSRVPGRDWGTGVYIPMRNHQGVVVGYTIRQSDGMIPKYLNSEGIKKSSLLFGFSENRPEIKASQTAILVEGQFDCISLWEKGFRNVVALMGKNMFPQQAHLLLPIAKHLIVLLDGDKWGYKAAKKLAHTWGSIFDVKVIPLPLGMDPDEYDENELQNRIKEIALWPRGMDSKELEQTGSETDMQSPQTKLGSRQAAELQIM